MSICPRETAAERKPQREMEDSLHLKQKLKYNCQSKFGILFARR